MESEMNRQGVKEEESCAGSFQVPALIKTNSSAWEMTVN